MISICFPHNISKEQDKLLDLKLRMFEENSTYPYEILYLVNYKRPDLVYLGWNFLIRNAKYDLILWDNSDIVYAPGWDENVIKHQNTGDWIGLELVECGAIKVNENNIEKDFGRTADTFRREEFEQWAKEFAKDRPSYRKGFCWYSPSVFRKDWFISMGGFDTTEPFPAQNDVAFRKKAESFGQRFIVCNGLAYHFQRGYIHQGLEQERC